MIILKKKIELIIQQFQKNKNKKFLSPNKIVVRYKSSISAYKKFFSTPPPSMDVIKRINSFFDISFLKYLNYYMITFIQVKIFD